MHVRRLVTLATAVAVASTSSVVAGTASSASAIYVVDGGTKQCEGYTHISIAAAVEAAVAGDVVEICPGRYEERVIVDKTMTIRANAEAFDALEALSCFTDVFAIDPTRQAVVASTDNLAVPLFDLRADNIVLQGLVLQGLGHVLRRTDTHAVATSRDYSGFQVHHNVITGHDVAILFRSNGVKPSAFGHNCVRDNGWGLANNFQPLAEARIHDNFTFRTANFAFEQTGPAGAMQNVTFDHNRSRADATGYRFSHSINTIAFDNIVEGARFGMRLAGGNQALHIVDNHLDVLQVGIPSATSEAGVKLPPNFRVVIKENTIVGTGASTGIGMGGGALKDSFIVENLVHGLSGEGIVLLADNTGNAISENTVTDNRGNGIRMAAGATNNKLIKNHISGALATSQIPKPVDARDDNQPINEWSENVCDIDFPVGAICGVE